MRVTILYICPDDSLGGSSRSLLSMILSMKGDVYPIVLFSSRGLAYEEFQKYGIETIVHPYIKLHQISTWKNVLQHPWRFLLFRIFQYDIACALYVKRYLKGRKIDIVHSNFSPIYIGVLLSQILRAKHVWHVREFIDLHFHNDIYGGKPLLSRFINRADARIAISTAIKKHWKMPEHNTWVIHNAIRSVKDVCYIKPKYKYILYSAYMMSEAKGARRAIFAFAKSGIAQAGYVLKMMGNCPGDYKESLMSTIHECNISNSVEFIPCQTDVKAYFSHATLYLMTSDFEGLGRVTGEAMFYGCPVIAHASGGTLDIVKDGETGYLYNTIDECAQLIIKVSRENQEPLILRAQEFARNNLSLEVYGPKIMEVYNHVLSKNF